jgi:hypothetical protein
MLHNIPFYFFITICIALTMTVLVWAISGLFLFFNASLTTRAHRKILFHITYPTSIGYGIIISQSINQGSYILQGNILLIGSILLFIGSFLEKGVFIRRKTIRSSIVWNLMCISWSIVFPINVEKLFLIF